MQIYFYPFGNLDDFHLGTWLVFTWELGRILLGNLDEFCLGTWTDFVWELGRIFSYYPFVLPIKKGRNALHPYRGGQIHLSTGCVMNLFQIVSHCQFPISFIISAIPSASTTLSIEGDFSCSVIYGRWTNNVFVGKCFFATK